MTKEELEKEAYLYAENSKDVQNFECGFDIAFKSYLAGAEPREKRIAELEVTNKKISNECHKLVDSLEKKQNENELLETQNIKLQAEVSRLTIKNAELKLKLEALEGQTPWKDIKDRSELIKENKELEEENAVLERRIERAKECMKKLLFIINSDPANYNCKGLVKDAEDFIHNRTCNIRQQGQHCITEERCIMCDK